MTTIPHKNINKRHLSSHLSLLYPLALALILSPLLSQYPSVSANELNRILERNRGSFIVQMEEEDFPKIALPMAKYECHSLFAGAPCSYMVGGGVEQAIPTTTTPPHSNIPFRAHKVVSLVPHPDRDRNSGETIAQNIIVEALVRQFKDQSRFAGTNNESNIDGERAMMIGGSANQHSVIDFFQDESLHHSAESKRELKNDQNSRLFDDKHDTDSHVILNKRQRFSHYIFPNDPIVRAFPSHSLEYMGKQLGEFQKFTQQNSQNNQNSLQKQFGGNMNNPGGIVTKSSNKPRTPPLQIGQTEDGHLTIQATLDQYQYFPIDNTDDPIAVQDYLIKMDENDIESMKMVLEQEIRKQMAEVMIMGIEEEQIEQVVEQMQQLFVQNLLLQQTQAKLNRELVNSTQQQKQQQQQQHGQTTSSPSSTTSTSTSPPSSSSSQPPQQSPQSQQQKPIELEITAEDYELLKDSSTGQLDQNKLQQYLIQRGYGDVLNQHENDANDNGLLDGYNTAVITEDELKKLYADEDGNIDHDLLFSHMEEYMVDFTDGDENDLLTPEMMEEYQKMVQQMEKEKKENEEKDKK